MGPVCIRTPQPGQFVSDPGYWLGVGFSRTEVPARREAGSIPGQTLCEREIPTQRLENELPGADSRRIPDLAGTSFQKGADQIRNELIGRPITAANGIASSGARQGDTMSRK